MVGRCACAYAYLSGGRPRYYRNRTKFGRKVYIICISERRQPIYYRNRTQFWSDGACVCAHVHVLPPTRCVPTLSLSLSHSHTHRSLSLSLSLTLSLTSAKKNTLSSPTQLTETHAEDVEPAATVSFLGATRTAKMAALPARPVFAGVILSTFGVLPGRSVRDRGMLVRVHPNPSSVQTPAERVAHCPFSPGGEPPSPFPPPLPARRESAQRRYRSQTTRTLSHIATGARQ